VGLQWELEVVVEEEELQERWQAEAQVRLEAPAMELVA
jgi:hypothetical protein